MKTARYVLTVILLTAVASARIEPATAPIKHQPVKVADLREGLRIFATQTVCRGIQQTTPPEYAEAVTGYFRQVGKVFCDMQTSGDFTHSGLLVAIEKIPSPLVTDTYALDAKLLLLSLYRVVYADRLRAEVPPDRWLSQASQAFCEAISDGLTDAGKTGIK